MTPEILLSMIQNLRKGELLQLSDEDAVYLKLTYDIDTSVLKEQATDIRFVLFLTTLFNEVDLSREDKMKIGHDILSKRGNLFLIN